jgi:hypothetical protein
MRDIILRHNRLNGLAFSIVEFGLIALFVSAFGSYYAVHERFGMSVIAWGIALNCLPVVVYGVQQWVQDRAAGIKGVSFWDKGSRDRLKKENPRMLRDTLVLTVGTLLPFVCFVTVLFNEFRRR